MRRRQKSIAIVLAVAATSAAVIVVAAGSAADTRVQAPTLNSRVMNTQRAPAQSVTLHGRQHVDGRDWALQRYVNTTGQTCAGEIVPGEGQGLTCRDPQTLFTNAPLVYFVGARQLPGHLRSWDNVWVWGFASPAISKLQLTKTDCSTEEIAIDSSGLFFRVFSQLELKTEIAPAKLQAYGKDGLLGSWDTPLGAPSTPQARGAGATAPKLPATCG